MFESVGLLAGCRMKTRATFFNRILSVALAAFGILAVTAPLLISTPAHAQFPFFDWGDQPRRRAAPPPQRQQQFNPFGGLFEPAPPDTYHRERAPTRRRSVDRERAPVESNRPPTARAKDGTPTTSVVVLGDSMAEWLAYGLDDAYSDNSEVGIVRKIRPNASLIRHESRTEGYDAVAATKDILAGEKAAFVVIMMGVVDRQPIRERPARTPPAPPPGPGEFPRRHRLSRSRQAPPPRTSSGRRSGPSSIPSASTT